MAVAGRDEWESERVVGRRGAAIRGPVQSSWVASIAASSEGRQSRAIEQRIGDGVGRLSLGHVVSGRWQSHDGRDHGEDDGAELHGEGLEELKVLT